MLGELTADLIFSYFLIFTRIGVAMMLLPAISQASINPRARLALALALSLVLLPAVEGKLPKFHDNVLQMFTFALKEMIIGVFIGTVAKIIQSTLHTAGQII